METNFKRTASNFMIKCIGRALQIKYIKNVYVPLHPCQIHSLDSLVLFLRLVVVPQLHSPVLLHSQGVGVRPVGVHPVLLYRDRDRDHDDGAANGASDIVDRWDRRGLFRSL